MTDPTQPVVARSRGELAERRLLHKPGHNLYLPGVAEEVQNRRPNVDVTSVGQQPRVSA